VSAAAQPRRPPELGDFLAEPTRDLGDWQWLWAGDREFPVRSHRGFWGSLIVACKRLLRPAVVAPQQDLWDRQRSFNLIQIEYLQRLEAARQVYAERLGWLEGAMQQGLADVMLHNDGLYARVDQKLDRYRRLAWELNARLGAALALAEHEAPGGERTPPAIDEIGYLEFEDSHRGTEDEIAARVARYLPYLAGRGDVLDLGCGRGEALAVFGGAGLLARGVDASAQMVAHCNGRGLHAEQGDLVDVLARCAADSLGAVVSFHVIEHLPPALVDRLVRLAWRALRPGGVLILETPNPLSLVVAARNFWLDPTHLRPVHPETLTVLFRRAGFDPVQRLDLSPFTSAQRLPELDVAKAPAELQELAAQAARLRDQLDDLLFGYQDYGLVGEKAQGD
jgi:SAM-dependent methyltransferase